MRAPFVFFMGNAFPYFVIMMLPGSSASTTASGSSPFTGRRRGTTGSAPGCSGTKGRLSAQSGHKFSFILFIYLFSHFFCFNTQEPRRGRVHPSGPGLLSGRRRPDSEVPHRGGGGPGGGRRGHGLSLCQIKKPAANCLNKFCY